MCRSILQVRFLQYWTFAVVVGSGLIHGPVEAGMLSFHVDPATIDGDNDGFITGNEFSPVGDDGVAFTMEPTDNLVGGDRFLLSLNNGLHFGGGGGSTLSFDFSADHDIELESYSLATHFAFLGDPVFDIRQGTDVLSTSNTSVASGDAHSFNSDPVSIEAGMTYTFITEAGGAGVQSFMSSWQYTVIPEPSMIMILTATLSVGCLARRRRVR